MPRLCFNWPFRIASPLNLFPNRRVNRMTADASKLDLIRSHFSPMIGRRLAYYRTAELLLADGSWSPWPDLPIRLYTSPESLVAVSWSRFEDLELSNLGELPIWADDATTRWVENGITRINPCLNCVIESVWLGRGQMTWDGREIEIWSSLLISVGDTWLEVFNALDENGYDIHTKFPDGEFVRCI